MPLLTLANADLAYGDLPLLDRASFALEERERIGLIGRNGSGKSSLLGALAGLVALDDGERTRLGRESRGDLAPAAGGAECASPTRSSSRSPRWPSR